MSGRVRCVERTYDGRTIGGWPCCSPAKKDEDGQMRCGVHSKAAQRKRDEKRAARWKAESDARDRRLALHSAEREVLEAGLALLAKHDNPEVRAGLDSAFQLAWVHGMRYTGPTWEAELERMRTAARRYRALLDGKGAERSSYQAASGVSSCGHFIERCECGRVLSQCRCPGPKSVRIKGPCNCTGKEAT